VPWNDGISLAVKEWPPATKKRNYAIRKPTSNIRNRRIEYIPRGREEDIAF